MEERRTKSIAVGDVRHSVPASLERGRLRSRGQPFPQNEPRRFLAACTEPAEGTMYITAKEQI